MNVIRRTPEKDKRRDQKNRGFVLVMYALVLGTLLVFAGFAVDVANWWLTASRLQKAADASALGSVVLLPGNIAPAQTLANTISGQNGYSPGGAGSTTVTASQGNSPNQIQVAVSTTVTNFFGGIVGVGTTRITRRGTAEYYAPVPMGSPDAQFGNDPDPGGLTPNLWLNTFGPNSDSQNGDEYAARTCSTGSYSCSSNLNAKFDPNGYFFDIHVSATQSGQPLTVQVYDPAFLNTGDTCANNMPSQAQADALQSTYGGGNAFYGDAGQRYAPGRSGPLFVSPFCPGDNNSNPKIAGGANNNMVTTYILRTPVVGTPDPSANPVSLDCTPKQYKALDTPLYPYLNPADGTGSYGGPDGAYVRSNFHRWSTVCTIPAGNVVAGDYYLQVVTTSPNGTPLGIGTVTDTGGQNRYSVRVGYGSAAPLNTTGVQLYANGKLPIYVNAVNANGSAGSPSFYLARVLPAGGGHTLQLNFFDIGDVSSGNTNFQLVPPGDMTVNGVPGSGTTSCTFSRDDNASIGNNANCSISGINGTFNGRLVTVLIPIPANYSCNVSDPLGCWWHINMSYTGNGVQPLDTTTWSANILGEPVHLTK